MITIYAVFYCFIGSQLPCMQVYGSSYQTLDDCDRARTKIEPAFGPVGGFKAGTVELVCKSKVIPVWEPAR